MKTVRYVYWQENEMWLGYLEEFPDYRTEGHSLEELQENLKDIFQEIASGTIPHIKHVGDLQIA
jgi:predicted RNase H-like HicB family nuclease